MSIAKRHLRDVAIIGISASPSKTSSTAKVLDNILDRLTAEGASTKHIRICDLPAAALFAGDPHEAGIAEALKALDESVGVVVSTPIYKAAYSGVLKLFLDLMPQFALAGKTVFPVATGGSTAHVLALDYALRPVLQSMGARHVVQSLMIPVGDLTITGCDVTFNESIAVALNEAIYHMRCSILGDTADRLLGHPRPERAV